MTGIMLQARMGSTRLPGKVMKNICGRTMLEHILTRLKLATEADVLIVATTTKDMDDCICELALSQGVFCYRGDEADVLDRYYQAAVHFGLRHIVRATADNPLVDPEEIDRLIRLHKDTSADYTHAFGQLPLGVGTECFTMEALERSWMEGVEPNHREHVNEYIQERPRMFHIEELEIPEKKRAPLLRLTVDTVEDMQRVGSIYESLYVAGCWISTEEAIRACAL